MRVLVIGNSTRGIVCSARRAGHTVYALDRFCDVDTRLCADKVLSVTPEPGLYELTESFGSVDAVILGPGFEKLKFKNVLNNSVKVTEEVSDKLKAAERFSSMGIPHPATEPLDRASGLKYPLMVKPRSGSGGMRNAVVRDEDELTLFKERVDAHEFIAQEFVDGIPCSASLIGTGDNAAVVALNEQLIGIPWLTRLPFAYCGNVTPFRTEFSSEMVKYAEQIALEFGLVGSNGVDFIQTEKGTVVIEANPRFQGSLDTIELSTGMNIFEAHVKSFSGELPKLKGYACSAAKAILLAGRKVAVVLELSDRLVKCMGANRTADVPRAGSIILPDEPVTSLLATGGTREIALETVNKYARYINGKLKVL